MEKIGGFGGIMGLLPGVAKMKEQIASANLDDKMIKRQRAIILSMTPEERRNPDILKASRKKRIAAGSGAKVEDVNKLLKQHRQMADMMKSMGGGKRGGGMMGKAAQMMGIGRGMPTPSPGGAAEVAEEARRRRRRQAPGRHSGGAAGRIFFAKAEPAGARRRLAERAQSVREEEMKRESAIGVENAAHCTHPNSQTGTKHMSLKIRLARGGAKKRPFYRVVVADSRSPARRPLHREARHLRSAEGRRTPPTASCSTPRRPRTGSPRARSRPTASPACSTSVGVLKREARNNPQKAQPKKKAQERAAAAAAAAEAADGASDARIASEAKPSDPCGEAASRSASSAALLAMRCGGDATDTRAVRPRP